MQVEFYFFGKVYYLYEIQKYVGVKTPFIRIGGDYNYPKSLHNPHHEPILIPPNFKFKFVTCLMFKNQISLYLELPHNLPKTTKPLNE